MALALPCLALVLALVCGLMSYAFLWAAWSLTVHQDRMICLILAVIFAGLTVPLAFLAGWMWPLWK